MRLLFVIILFFSGISCDSAGKESIEVDVETLTNPKENIPDQSMANPGEITFNIKIVESYNTTKDICGLSKKYVFLTEVVEILEKGMGIINAPHKKQQLLVNFIQLPKDLEINNIIKAKAKESLCPDASKTYYTINTYKILE